VQCRVQVELFQLPTLVGIQLKQFAIGFEVVALSTTIGPYPVLFS
jgi:hypothetical protein